MTPGSPLGAPTSSSIAFPPPRRRRPYPRSHRSIRRHRDERENGNDREGRCRRVADRSAAGEQEPLLDQAVAVAPQDVLQVGRARLRRTDMHIDGARSRSRARRHVHMVGVVRARAAIGAMSAAASNANSKIESCPCMSAKATG